MYSGGLDSFIACAYAEWRGFAPIPIYVDLYHPYHQKEREAISNLPVMPYFVPIPLYYMIEDRIKDHIIPSRNVLFATIGGMFASTVWICALDGEQLGKEHDKSDRFFEDTTRLLSFTNEYFQPVTVVETPFKYLSKAEIIHWALTHGVELSDLRKTSSCYSADKGNCGECLTCYKRYAAFMLNHIDTRRDFLTDPLLSDYAKEIDEKIPEADRNQDFSRFTRKRVHEHFELKAILINHYYRLADEFL